MSDTLKTETRRNDDSSADNTHLECDSRTGSGTLNTRAETERRVRIPAPLKRFGHRLVGDDPPLLVSHDEARRRRGADTTFAQSNEAGAPDRGPPLHIGPHPAISNPVLTRGDVSDIEDVRFVADPFVVREGAVYHAFFEIKSHAESAVLGFVKGGEAFDIGHATSPDGREWTYRGVVLPAAQAEHTYPYVFQHHGDYYMSPCPAGDTPAAFRLYRADPFPTDWELVSESIVGDVRTDPTPFEWHGTWFLPYQASDSFEVRLRYADDLLADEWVEHPASPLFDPGGNDVSLGGRPIVHEDGVDLFFRRGTPGIVEHWRVSEASTTTWSMRELPSSPVVAGVGGRGWNGRNVHHVDFGPFVEAGADVVVVDGQDVIGEYRIGVYGPRHITN
jgi:hypothetical protein